MRVPFVVFTRPCYRAVAVPARETVAHRRSPHNVALACRKPQAAGVGRHGERVLPSAADARAAAEHSPPVRRRWLLALAGCILVSAIVAPTTHARPLQKGF